MWLPLQGSVILSQTPCPLLPTHYPGKEQKNKKRCFHLSWYFLYFSVFLGEDSWFHKNKSVLANGSLLHMNVTKASPTPPNGVPTGVYRRRCHFPVVAYGASWGLLFQAHLLYSHLTHSPLQLQQTTSMFTGLPWRFMTYSLHVCFPPCDEHCQLNIGHPAPSLVSFFTPSLQHHSWPLRGAQVLGEGANEWRWCFNWTLLWILEL